MNIIAHRGCWKKPKEKNTLLAFERAFKHGYGIETDIRDYKGELVISHDVADESCIKLAEFLELYQSTGCESVLALNIKADGICNLLYRVLMEYEIGRYFAFDMSVPEMVLYRKAGCKYYARQSDIEQDPILYQDAEGVWLDAFYAYDWMKSDVIKRHVSQGKDVVIVSPELHGMDSEFLWNDLKENGFSSNERLFLCTDRPEAAEKYFGGLQ